MRLEPSAFDSQHYDLRIGRLHREAADDARSVASAREAARKEGFDVLFLRLDAGDDLCADLGAPIDTLVTSTLGRERHAVANSSATIEHHDRLVGPDVAVIESITDTITTSHLHADPRLPLDRTRRLYAAWARNDVTGRAQRVIVARIAGQIAGYLSILVREAAIIDLVAVSPAHQGIGIGSAMLASFVDWVDAQGFAATVGTQATNPALRLYARHGFAPTHTDLTYHLWLS